MESNAVALYPLWNNARTHRVSPAGLKKVAPEDVLLFCILLIRNIISSMLLILSNLQQIGINMNMTSFHIRVVGIGCCCC